MRTKKQQKFQNIDEEGIETPNIQHVSPTEYFHENKSVVVVDDDDKLGKPRPKLNDSFNNAEEEDQEDDPEFDASLPLQTPDFKGRIVIGEQKTSARANPVPIEEGDQEEYQE